MSLKSKLITTVIYNSNPVSLPANDVGLFSIVMLESMSVHMISSRLIYSGSLLNPPTNPDSVFFNHQVAFQGISFDVPRYRSGIALPANAAYFLSENPPTLDPAPDDYARTVSNRYYFTPENYRQLCSISVADGSQIYCDLRNQNNADGVDMNENAQLKWYLELFYED